MGLEVNSHIIAKCLITKTLKQDVVQQLIDFLLDPDEILLERFDDETFCNDIAVHS